MLGRVHTRAFITRVPGITRIDPGRQSSMNRKNARKIDTDEIAMDRAMFVCARFESLNFAIVMSDLCT